MSTTIELARNDVEFMHHWDALCDNAPEIRGDDKLFVQAYLDYQERQKELELEAELFEEAYAEYALMNAWCPTHGKVEGQHCPVCSN